MQMDEWSPSGRSARIHEISRRPVSSRFVSAVSLHAHTHHSNEVMASVPAYLNRIPVVAGLFQREMQKYVERHGEVADFGKGWWHPPVAPEAVLGSEATQITQSLGLAPFVSITDHDSITAGLSLQASHPGTPVSFEWTVPYEEGFFHVGVHNLPLASAEARFERLTAFTGDPRSGMLAPLLDELHADPHVLIVLNHPLWDLAGVGARRHQVLLDQFLARYASRMHALEANGYRSWGENAGAGVLAERLSLPLISGGDRHGYAPNSLINLTSATSFDEFVREIREDRASDLAMLPHYRQPLVARKLAVAADVIRANRSNPPGQRHWTDRVSYDRQGVITPLSRHWPTGGPLWVRSTMRVFLVLTSAPLLPAMAFMTVMLAGPAAMDAPDPVQSVDVRTTAAPGTTVPPAGVGE